MDPIVHLFCLSQAAIFIDRSVHQKCTVASDLRVASPTSRYSGSVPDVTWQRPDGKYASWMEQARDLETANTPISQIERWSELIATVLFCLRRQRK